jgi:PAS domain S-box-containing protein
LIYRTLFSAGSIPPFFKAMKTIMLFKCLLLSSFFKNFAKSTKLWVCNIIIKKRGGREIGKLEDCFFMEFFGWDQKKLKSMTKEDLVKELLIIEKAFNNLKQRNLNEAIGNMPIAAVSFDKAGRVLQSNKLFDTLPVWKDRKPPIKISDFLSESLFQHIDKCIKAGLKAPLVLGNELIANCLFELSLVQIDVETFGLTFYNIGNLHQFKTISETVFNRLPDGICIMEKSNNSIINVNQKFCDMLGMDENELIGKHISILHPKTSHKKMLKNINRVKQHDYLIVEEVPVMHKDGRIFYCDIVNVEVIIDNSPVVLGFFRDITEKLQTNAQLIALLQESREKELVLKEAQKVGHIGHWEYFVDRDHLVWSDETHSILEIPKTAARLSYQSYARIIHPEDSDSFQKAYEAHLMNKAPYDHVHRILTPSGEIKWVRNTCETIFHENGQPNYSIGAIADFTKLKETEAGLQYERDYSQALVNSLPDLLFVLGFDGFFRDVKSNPNLHKGLEPKNFIGKHIAEVLPKKFAQKVGELLMDVQNDAAINTFKFSWAEIDGSESFFSAKFTRFGSDALMCLVRDITLEHNSQKSLLEREKELKFLYENMAQGIVYQDANGVITRANKAAEEILGLSLAQMLGKRSIDPDWNTIKEDGSPFPGEDHPAMVALKTGKPVYNVKMGVNYPRKSKSTWILVNAIPEFEPGAKKPKSVFATITDITELKTYEREIVKSQDLLEQAGKIAEVGVFDYNVAANNLYWSSALRNVFEVPEDFEPHWDKTFTFFDDASWARIDLATKKTLATGCPMDLELTFKTFTGKKRWARIIGKAVFEGKKPVRLFGSFQDITNQHTAIEALKRQGELQNLLIDISNTYINLSKDELECNLQRSMERLGKFVGADRFYIFDYDWEKVTATNTHEWCAPDIEPQLENLKDVPVDGLHDWTLNHRKGLNFGILDVMALPEDNYARAILEPQDIKSIYTVPLMENKKCIGFIGLDFVKKQYRFSKIEKRLLEVFADLLSNVRMRFKTHSELIEYRELLTDVIEKSQSVIFQKKPDGTYLMVNESFEKATGLSKSEIIGKTDFELFPHDIAQHLSANDQKVLTTNQHLLIEEEISTAEGVKYFQSSKFPVRDASGLVIGVAGMSVDLTARKLTELELRKSEALFKQIFKDSMAPMLLIDFHTKMILDSNRAAQNLYGYSEEAFKTKSIFDIYTSLSFVYQKLADLKTRVQLECEAIHKNKNGETLNVKTFSSLIEIENKLMVFEVLEDVSDRNRYLKTIEKQNEIFRDISWTQSHVVRAPLSRLLGLVDLLKTKNYQVMPLEALVDEINNSAIELDSLIREISEKTYLANNLIKPSDN